MKMKLKPHEALNLILRPPFSRTIWDWKLRKLAACATWRAAHPSRIPPTEVGGSLRSDLPTPDAADPLPNTPNGSWGIVKVRPIHPSRHLLVGAIAILLALTLAESAASPGASAFAQTN